LAKKVNTTVLQTIPFGIYHTQHGMDQSLTGVNKKKMNQ